MMHKLSIFSTNKYYRFSTGFALAIALLIGGLAVSNESQAAGAEYRLDKARTSITDIDSLRRGAQLFAMNCVACHSAQYVRYSRIGEDLEWTNDELRENMNVLGSIFDPIQSALTEEAALAAYGVVPPDLSLRARIRGLDWILSYMKGFYVDPDSPTGANNVIYPNTAMTNVLVAMQGLQEPVYEEVNEEYADAGEAPDRAIIGLQSASDGIMNRKEFHNAMLDLVNFMDYMSEPAKLKRVQLGWKVMLFLFILIILTYFVKREYWKDIPQN